MGQDVPAKGQLYWHCRRGTKELDHILGGFLSQAYSGLSPTEQQSFAQLLECQDPEITDWLMAVKQPDNANIALIIECLRFHAGIKAGE